MKQTQERVGFRLTRQAFARIEAAAAAEERSISNFLRIVVDDYIARQTGRGEATIAKPTARRARRDREPAQAGT